MLVNKLKAARCYIIKLKEKVYIKIELKVAKA
jgi:hypothetical protein